MVQKILNREGATKMEYCDVCILCALDEEAKAFKQVLKEHGIPYCKKI